MLVSVLIYLVLLTYIDEYRLNNKTGNVWIGRSINCVNLPYSVR